MNLEQLTAAIEAARTNIASQYVGFDADDWDVANSRSSADAAINLVEHYLHAAIARAIPQRVSLTGLGWLVATEVN